MASWPLVADASVDLAVALGYGIVAWRLSSRDVPDDDRRAWSTLTLWWWGLACTGLLATALSVLALGEPDVAVFGALSFLIVFAFTVGMVGLTLHLAETFAPGHRWLRWAIIAVYGTYQSMQGWLLLTSTPTGVMMQGWRPVLDAAPPPAWSLVVSFALMLVPPFVGAGAYAARIGAGVRRMPPSHSLGLAASLVLWLASVVLIAEPDLAHASAWQAAARAMILLSAGVIYVTNEARSSTTQISPRPFSKRS